MSFLLQLYKYKLFAQLFHHAYLLDLSLNIMFIKLKHILKASDLATEHFLNLETRPYENQWCPDYIHCLFIILNSLNFFRHSHSTPLALLFYDGISCGINGGFPCDAIDDVFVAFRGYYSEHKYIFI